ncbi:hypothetical protein P691DRAFT_760312 [Macrolepiota fuliginosa MF-IS2]|uniref:Uncharacterized protein n=1 Tax=Macrolepiota fuliginosa MF-IS2 TaxID=1400762 RepID=A0A9P6C1N3_9AGAR|nr:hypothetical protein P691DRAFT_760312 [Macrolepiota fuliginosa MF-IS2]
MSTNSLPLTIANASGALLVGACLTLGTVCFILLSSQTGTPPEQCHLLQLYIAALIVAVIGYFLSYFLFNNVQAIFHPHAETGKDMANHDTARSALSKAVGFFAAVIISMTDGILTAKLSFGNKAPVGRYNSTMGILLESAVINVPIAICVAVKNMPTTNVAIAWAIAGAIFAPCQGFATILIIYQVALGRAIGQQNREEVTLVMDSKSHDVPEDIQI